eukprot:593490-Prymnesium_polylepis.1
MAEEAQKEAQRVTQKEAAELQRMSARMSRGGKAASAFTAAKGLAALGKARPRRCCGRARRSRRR